MEKIRSRYSVLVIGSVEKVKEIAKKHEVELEPSDFAQDKGFIIEVEEEVLGTHPLVVELRKSKETFGVSREYGMMHPPIKKKRKS